MPEVDNTKRPWIPFMIGLAAAGLVFWLALGSGDGAGPNERNDTPSSRDGLSNALRPSSSLDDDGNPRLHIETGGRLKLRDRDLPQDSAVSVTLALSDEARGDATRKVRIVSADAGRLDAEATPLPGSGSGVRLDIERDYLAPGLYMIEVDTVDHHPLQFRRYVLEIE